MSKRAEEAALKAYPKEIRDKNGIVIDIGHPQWIRDYYIEGYRQAEKDLSDKAKYSSGWDGFYYGKGYEQAEKDLGWHSVEECLPPMDEEVIVLTDVTGDSLIRGSNRLCFGHIVDKNIAIDYDGWNIPGVHHWMYCPKLPEDII